MSGLKLFAFVAGHLLNLSLGLASIAIVVLIGVLLNVSSYIQQIVIGLIIVLAVAFNTYAKSRRRRA